MRAALGDSADSPRLIETLPRRGYTGFIAPVTVDTPHARIPDSGQTAATQGRLSEAEAQAPVAVSESDQAAAKQPTTRRKVRRSPMLVGALTVAALATVVVVVFNIGEKRAASGPPRVGRSRSSTRNLSGDHDQEYLADGINRRVITELEIRSVRVISRTSILSYKGARKSLPEIGRELGVDAVVEGSVVRSGNRIRITAQLLEAASDRHLWAQAFERDVHDVVALYADVAEAIGSEIHANIDRAATAVVRARPVDPEAWASYVRGRYLWERQGADNLKKARDYFRQAIDRQPDYALASQAWRTSPRLNCATAPTACENLPTEAVQKQRGGLKALELEPSLPSVPRAGRNRCTFERD